MIPALLIAVAVQQPSLNPRTDWFQEAGYGVFVHYLSGLQNDAEQLHSLGCETSWDECVAQFDTDAFAATMNEVGAGYVIFTVMQRKRTMIAPNANSGFPLLPPALVRRGKPFAEKLLACVRR